MVLSDAFSYLEKKHVHHQHLMKLWSLALRVCVGNAALCVARCGGSKFTKETKPTPIIYTPSPKKTESRKPYRVAATRRSHRRYTEARRLEIGNSILGQWLGVEGGSFQGEKPGELGEMEVNMARSLRQQRRFRWWQLKYVLCLSLFGEDEPIFTSIFFKWIGSTTNEKRS